MYKKSWYKLATEYPIDTTYGEKGFERDIKINPNSIGGSSGAVCEYKVGDMVAYQGDTHNAHYLLRNIFVISDIYVNPDDECESTIKVRKYHVNLENAYSIELIEDDPTNIWTLNMTTIRKIDENEIASRLPEAIRIEKYREQPKKIRPRRLFEQESLLVSI